MSKEKAAAEEKQSGTKKATTESKKDIPQATEDAKELAQKIFSKLKEN